jgi:hypothetical protein
MGTNDRHVTSAWGLFARAIHALSAGGPEACGVVHLLSQAGSLNPPEQEVTRGGTLELLAALAAEPPPVETLTHAAAIQGRFWLSQLVEKLTRADSPFTGVAALTLTRARGRLGVSGKVNEAMT